MTSKADKKNADIWLINEAKTVKTAFLAATFSTIVAFLLAVFMAKELAKACHLVIFQGGGVTDVTPAAMIIVTLALLRGLFTYLSECRLATAAARLKFSIRNRLYLRGLESGSTGRNITDGEFIEVVTTGVDALDSYFTRFMQHVSQVVLLPPLILFFTFPADWRPSLALLLSAPFIPVLMILIARGAQSLNDRQWGKLVRLSGYLIDLVRGMPDIRICSAAKNEAELIAQASEEYRRSTMSVLKIAFVSAFTLEFFSTVGTAMVAVIIGFRLLAGTLPLSQGLFILLLAPEFYLPFRNLGLSYHARMQGVAAAETILAVVAGKSGDSGTMDPVFPDKTVTIRYENVSFSYGGGRGGVRNLSMELDQGRITALSGESGAGKSTAAQLLLAISHPDSGRITVGGTDLALVDGEKWRKNIALMPQKPFFFAGTIRENLMIGMESCSDSELFAALESASAAGFINALAEGLDTRLGEGGAGVSGGELRRLALTRVFLRNSPVVILDEPTAGLDRDTEASVCASIKALAIGRFLLLITHSTSAADLADTQIQLVADQPDSGEVDHG